MATYTNIPKPTDSTWNPIITKGQEQYDQSNIFYDDTAVFYDGINIADWTNVLKPVSAQKFIRAGMITGLLGPVTYSTAYSIGQAEWNKIIKPTS